MTRVVFSYSGNRVSGFRIKGHTAETDSEEARLVCAAVSSAAYMAANTVTDIIGAAADVLEDDAEMKLTLASPDDLTDTVLLGLKLHLEGLSEQYGNYIKVSLEV